jgi:hypothetical protein
MVQFASRALGNVRCCILLYGKHLLWRMAHSECKPGVSLTGWSSKNFFDNVINKFHHFLVSISLRQNLFLAKTLLDQPLLVDIFQFMSYFSNAGFKELSPPAVNLKKLVKETVCREPILIVISPGADPSQVSQILQATLNVQHSSINGSTLLTYSCTRAQHASH